jgi:hypothetical protein
MFWSALIFGLMGSFHCIGMCGPIAFMLPVDRSSNIKKNSQIFLYHIGRILAYSLIGLLFGILGKGFYLFGFQQQLSIIIGSLMILIAFIPYTYFARYNFSKPLFRIISTVKSKLGKALKRKSLDTFLTIGFLNGFLPCGLVYMAVFGAISVGDPLQGALYMAIFGLGTIPLMTTAIYFGNFLKGKARRYITNAIPYVVAVMGLLFVLRGLGLGIPYLSPPNMQQKVNASYNCNTPK